jgi:transcriptional regulator with XRE-family HTH domain
MERGARLRYRERLMIVSEARPVGELLRQWRLRRRKSQLALATQANVSTRHLSFLETGRSDPSRAMVLALAEELEVPLRERNALLIAAGFAPIFPERSLSDPTLESARHVVEIVLSGYEPFPALAVDRHWTLVSANRAVTALMTGADPSLVQPPINVLRLSLHPLGLAPQIANLAEWHAHVAARLKRQAEMTADPVLEALHREIESYAPRDAHQSDPAPGSAVAVLFQMKSDAGVLSFYTTTMVFGTPVDVTLSELAIEAFFPADAFTAAAVRQSGRPMS